VRAVVTAGSTLMPRRAIVPTAVFAASAWLRSW
jgi:hypothetical protein